MERTGQLPAGHVVAGRYEILASLGQGGMGVVYKAHDRVLGETAALKVLRPEVAGSAEMERRFLSEIKLARSVSHRNVCRIHEYGQDGALRFISMAFVEGKDLKQVLRDRGPLPAHEGFDVAIGIAEGLQAIHEEGIVHRDLKAANVMVDARAIPRLMDFGIAKQWAQEGSTGLTATGAVIGTPEYMSPEQAHGRRLDQRSDIYALGVVLYEIFTGDVPFRGDTPVATLMKHIQEPPPLAGAAAQRIPPPVLPILARALAKDPGERFASAREVADALRSARAEVVPPTTLIPSLAPTAPAPTVRAATVPAFTVPGATVTAAAAVPRTVVPGPPPAEQPRPRRTLLFACIAAGAVGLVMLLVTGVLVLRGPQRPAPQPPASSPPVPQVAPSMAAAAPAPSVAPTLPPAAAAAPPEPAPAAPRASTAPAERAGPRRPEVDGLLAEAESAFAAQQFDAALAFYEEALKLDPRDGRARLGRELCMKAMAAAAPAAAPRFVSGATAYTPARAAATGPAGFESSGAVSVRRVDQPAAAAGKIVFEVEPDKVTAGEPFVLKVFMVNDAAAPLELAGGVVTTVVDGRTAGGPVALAATSLRPRSRALVFSVTDRWRAELQGWSFSIALRTASGDAYSNSLSWKR